MANSLLLMMAINVASVSFLSCEVREFDFTIKEVMNFLECNIREFDFQRQDLNVVTILPLGESITSTGVLDCANKCSLRVNECFNFIYDKSSHQCILAYIDVGSNPTLDLKSPNVYRSCKDVTDTTQPRQLVKLTSGLVVMCDTQTDGGGWTIFQRRVSGAVDFNRSWAEYRNGFGDYGVGDFYLGNENIFCINSKARHELRIDMEYKGNSYNAIHSSFDFYSEADAYKLSVNGYGGNTWDSLTVLNNNQKFSTYDRDNDESNEENCALKFVSGWWFSHCHSANLNGIWGSTGYGTGLVWIYVTGPFDSVSFSEMKIRPLP
ncbi:ficolin-1-like [Physella acuta]|uniref:ficolin-1-like n=1 Tax=Physella acuta TaxID=109671 RepID=UPI0027DE1767|nr:ficolin-1-like [Physella acuta]